MYASLKNCKLNFQLICEMSFVITSGAHTDANYTFYAMYLSSILSEHD